MNQQPTFAVPQYPPPPASQHVAYQFPYPPAQQTQPAPQRPLRPFLISQQQQPQRLPQQQPPHQYYGAVRQNTPPAQPPAPGLQPRPQRRAPSRSNAPASSPPSPDNGPGAPPPEPNSPDEEEFDDLRQALQQHDGEGEGDDPDPIFNLPPPPENTYPDEDELEKAIHAWSLEHGYELVRRASKKNARGVLYKRYYHCSKHGQKSNTGRLTDETRQRANRKSNRMGCPMSIACVAVDPTNPEGDWQIRHRKTHHNHGPMEALTLAGHRRRARMGGVEKAVDGLFAIGTPTAQVLQFLQKTHANGLFTRTDVANMKLKWKKWGTCADRIQRGEQNRGVRGFPSACVPCKQKKVGCDSTRPVCSTCSQRAISCHYDHEPYAEDATMSFADDAPTETNLEAPDPVFVNPEPAQQQEQSRRRGRPSGSATRNQAVNPNQSIQTQQILADLQSFQASHVTQQRLTLQSSTVEILAQTSCGTGESYKAVPPLHQAQDWAHFRDRILEAALKENTYEVLVGEKAEPSKPAEGGAAEVDEWNEYIKQLAIFNRRNSLLLSALWSNLGPSFRNRVQAMTKASEVWGTLEELCQPRGSQQAYKLYLDLHSITLATSTSLQDYIHRLETSYTSFKQLKLNTSPPWHNRRKETLPTATSGADAVPEEMVCFLFLKGLGEAWERWIDGLCQTNNIGGFGTGERLGFRELCKRALGYEAMQRRELGR